MKKRLKKKIKDRELKTKAIFVIKNKNGQYKIYISKKFWNKGDKANGSMSIDKTGDYISVDYIRKLGFEYIGWIENSSIDLEVFKSWNNKNRLVKL
jgi:hypothetical protein